MAFEITPLSENVGIEVRGLDLDRPIDPTTRQRLRDVFIEKGVVAFRGLGTTPEAHLALSRCFGELQPHPVKENWVAGYPELIDITVHPVSDGDSSVALYEVDGVRRGGWLPWHSDLVYMDKINRGGILRGLTLPREGGRTGFIDQIRIYENLPEKLKRRIAGLHVIYQLQPDFTFEKYGKPDSLKLVTNSPAMAAMAARIGRDFPPVLHPMVFTQPETGRKVLNVSPFSAIAIHEMQNAEGDALLTEVVEHTINPEFAYFYEWRENDLILWDNWRSLHCAEGVPEDCTRKMQRTTIMGDYALGRRLPQ